MGALLVERGKGSERDVFYWAGKWRAGGKQVRRRLAKAWLIERARPLADVDGWRRLYRPRAGRVQEGYLTAAEAAQAMGKAMAAYEQERALQERQRGEVSFAEAAAAWMDHGRRVRRWKPSVAADYESMLYAPTREARLRGAPPSARTMRVYADRPVRAITADEIEAWLATLDREGLAPATVNKYRLLVGQVLDLAIERGWREGPNPAGATHRRRVRREPDLRILTMEQVEAVAACARDEQWRALILTAGYSGLRMGELRALRWGDVDHEARVIRVARAYSGEDLAAPKSGAARSVPLVPRLAEVLHGHAQRSDRVGPADLVFTRARGGPLEPSTIRGRYTEARDRARVEDPSIPADVRFHDLRHAYAPGLVRGGVDLVAVQRWMGHADVRTTSIYLHFAGNGDDADRAGRALGG